MGPDVREASGMGIGDFVAGFGEVLRIKGRALMMVERI
jgi:hypothetical protein